MKFLLSVILFTFTSLPNAHALTSPFAVSIFPPVQFPPSDISVTGLRFSALVGRHREMYGLDFAALGNITDGGFGGLAVSGLFNYNAGTASVVGLQFAGITNINLNKTRVIGLQIAGIMNYNKEEFYVAGLQIALANHSPFTKVYGMQVGAYNSGGDVYGLQIGLINFAKSLHGIQIGLANFNQAGPFAVAPLINVGF